MKGKLLAFACAASVAMAIAPATAATKDVAIRDNYFSPASLSGVMGTTFRWTNRGVNYHDSTYRGALGLWRSGRLSGAGAYGSGESFAKTLPWAATYPYSCTIHGFTGSIRIPDGVNRSTGSRSTVFTFTLGTVGPGSGRVFDVQRRKGSGSWVAYRTGLTVRTVTFRAGSLGTGTYSFRSRLRKVVSGADPVTGWSPPLSIRVS